ncbi:MAG: hypothetical protein Q7S03_01170 [bacterium]|nr:hypothetical protein [bacterium]
MMEKGADNTFSIGNLERLGFPKGLEVIRPANVDLFLAGAGQTNLPEAVAGNPRLIEQAAQRRKTVSSLDKIFGSIPDVSLDAETALDCGIISPENLAQTYQDLTDFLEADGENARLILYLPCQLLPGQKNSGNENLEEAKRKFKDVYLKDWRRLLKESDLKANFVDGDIPEEELGKGRPPLVRKAAHLIPELVERKIISVGEIIDIIEKEDDEVLKDSILETFPVLADMGQIDRPTWQRMFSSDKRELLAAALETSYVLRPKTTGNHENKQKPETPDVSGQELLIEISSGLKRDLEMHEAHYAALLENPGKIPLSRITWERQDKRDQIIDRYAEKIAQGLGNGKLTEGQISELLQKSDITTFEAATGVKGVFKTIEKLAENPEKAKLMYQNFREVLDQLKKDGSGETEDEITSGLCHLAALGIVEAKELQRYQIKIPRFDSISGVDLEEIISGQLRNFGPLVEQLRSTPDVQRVIFPAFLFFGSRLKGYSRAKADIDYAAFIRPQIEWSQKGQVDQILDKTAGDSRVGRASEFWLGEDGGKLKVKDVPLTSMAIADKNWDYVLLAGVWLGDKTEVRKLYQGLISGCLTTNRDKATRTDQLRRIEREVIQYRLMHRGYGRFYPRVGGIQTEHSGLINSESYFYDPGFRRVATKLFLGKVFLPELG